MTPSPRQRQILALVAQGPTNEQFARQLGCSHATVKFIIRLSLAELGASNRTGAVVEAIRRGWLDAERLAERTLTAPPH